MGLRFYYWDYYQSIEELPDVFVNNYNSHSGHSVSSLFVKRKYESFKEEIMEYSDISFYQYQNEVVVKAKHYQNTQKVKKIKAHSYCKYYYHYGIKEGTALSFNNLVSVILYTDYSSLCTNFSRSFRAISRMEELKDIKKRNSNYYHLSKILRETVECYGQCSDGDPPDFNNKLIGKFYSGMGIELSLCSFKIRLCSPTSTSKQKEVATKFSGDKGIIIQFDNPEGDEQCCYLRGWNCCWLSKYKEEDER